MIYTAEYMSNHSEMADDDILAFFTLAAASVDYFEIRHHTGMIAGLPYDEKPV